jgi:hypothetical protein
MRVSPFSPLCTRHGSVSKTGKETGCKKMRGKISDMRLYSSRSCLNRGTWRTKQAGNETLSRRLHIHSLASAPSRCTVGFLLNVFGGDKGGNHPLFSHISRLDQCTGRQCKAIPLPGHGSPWVCETSRLSHFMDNRLTDGGKVVSPKRRPALTPRKISGTHFC